jgi:lipoprotein-releasing system permease protein
MNTELFIARRLFSDKENKNQLSRKIIKVALVGIALGLTVMLIAVSIVTGFKKEIRDKVVGFGSHIQIINYDSNFSYETAPISSKQSFTPRLLEVENVKSVNTFATKPGIIKTDDYIQGIVLKGVDSTFDWSFFRKHLTDGSLPKYDGPNRSAEVLISANLCQLLRLKTGDPVYMYFINQDEQIPRVRQFRLAGIYNTHLQEFDDMFVIADIRQIRHVNDWESDQISGFEITITDFDKIDHTEQMIREHIVQYGVEKGTTLRSITVTRKYPQIFDWLSILDMNVWVILILMLLVAGFNMISALLVLILERSSMIGILKSLGSRNSSLKNIFLYLSAFLVSRGMLWGNLLGLSLLFLQKYFNLITLDPSSYYMEVVPVNFSLVNILLLNAGTLLITLAMLILPALFISRIAPDKSMRFD